MNRTAKTFLVLGLLAVVGMAFRVSWNALRDVAHTIGADPTAAFVYPLVVDGLMALALIATLVLGGDDRRLALRVLAGYTAASLVLNYVHGLVPAIAAGHRARLSEWAPANWALVLLATSLPVGSIFFGSDLVAKVLHHRPPAPAAEATCAVSTPAVTAAPFPAPAAADEGSVYRPEPRAAVPAVTRPRRTGGKPRKAPAKRAPRSADDLLIQAREATAGWADGELTAEGIRTALHVSSANARTLRDALRAERAARPALHPVPAPAPDPVSASARPTTDIPSTAESEEMAS